MLQILWARPRKPWIKSGLVRKLSFFSATTFINVRECVWNMWNLWYRDFFATKSMLVFDKWEPRCLFRQFIWSHKRQERDIRVDPAERDGSSQVPESREVAMFVGCPVCWGLESVGCVCLAMTATCCVMKLNSFRRVTLLHVCAAICWWIRDWKKQHLLKLWL